jgi:hypothetical protein
MYWKGERLALELGFVAICEEKEWIIEIELERKGKENNGRHSH